MPLISLPDVYTSATQARLAAIWLKTMNPESGLVSSGGTTALAAELRNEILRVFKVDVGMQTQLEDEAAFYRVAAVIDECLNAGPLGN